MCRPRREFKAGPFGLEGRLLLARGPAPLPAHIPPYLSPSVRFYGDPIPGGTGPTQVALQQDGKAIVPLGGFVPPGVGPFQVVVATDPSSPAVGVNVGAVHQTLTFTTSDSLADVTVPILAGAPNPGEVDVNLTLTPIDPPPGLKTFGPLELRVLASAAVIPPKIVSTQGNPQGIVLTFSKPMNPASASNVKNYAVRAATTSTKTNSFLVPIDALTFPLHMDSSLASWSSTSSRPVPLRAAEYDPATNSVTLVPRRTLTYGATISVSQGHPAKVPGRPGPSLNPGAVLTDQRGNPINGDTTPGNFQVFVHRGIQAVP